MVTVKHLSNVCGVSPHAVRYYSRIGLLKPGRHPENRYRVFDHSDINRLRFIRRAQYLGLTLSEISELLLLTDEGESPCMKIREYLEQHIEGNRQKMLELGALQHRMEMALSLWKSLPDSNPDAHTFCHLLDQTSIEVPAA
jgi:DNA-binding transcriptional MerR regulator